MLEKGEYKYKELTQDIINCAYTVHNQLGYGFLEKVYHNSLLIELAKRKIAAESQKCFRIEYDGHIVGEFFADILVDNKVIVEVKALERYGATFEPQLLNYLKASKLEVGLIINFGYSVQVKRMVP
jgi:GxxExxY protein